MKRLALFSPLPPSQTGVAQYSSLLLKRLSPHFDIEAFVEDEVFSEPRAFSLPGLLQQESFPALPWRDFGWKDVRRPFDLCVYQMGNSRHHQFIYPFVFHRPGVLVLHDLVLHHSRLKMFLESPEVDQYRQALHDREKRSAALEKLRQYAGEVEACYPDRGAAVAEICVQVGGGLSLYFFPLYELLSRASVMTLVHGRAAAAEVEQAVPGCTVRSIRMGVEVPPLPPQEVAKREMGLEGRWVLASFGWITPEKRISAGLRCLRRLVDAGVESFYILVGSTVEHYDVLSEARSLGVADRLRITGYVPEEDFWRYVAAADLCLNLRYPSAGETSSTSLRLMGAGKAVVISDLLHYLDWPQEAVARVDLRDEEDGLFWKALELQKNPGRLHTLQSAARDFVLREHSPEAMIADYRKCLHEALELPPPPRLTEPAHLAGWAGLVETASSQLAQEIDAPPEIIRTLYSPEIP